MLLYIYAGSLPINHQIIYQLQDVFNLLPDVELQSFVKSVYVKTNDQVREITPPFVSNCLSSNFSQILQWFALRIYNVYIYVYFFV